MNERGVNQYKKELLYRKANGKKLLNEYLGKIASLFPTEDRSEIIPLEETDAVLDRFKAASTQLHQKTERISGSGLHVELSAMKDHHRDMYVLIDEDWRYCGILRVKSTESLNVDFEFGNKILNDIVFIWADMSAAISFDFFEVSGNRLIDVKRWGVR
ncbi:hypothetical protein [Caballeronia sp. GAOx1]|uniref:Uncharacterized protein n=1 Tax=Caballeronia zhejiangensis TaxID=871203 RepID=A0A656QSB8_9BURK|nr:hypothetical protein [Caballeronia sp. GAOx1]KDR34245.1 hypothetical protein BG60_00305 [Caballeronia zhejiangensis]